MCQWGVAMMYRTTGHNGPSPQRHKPTLNAKGSYPSSSQPSPTIWVTNVGWAIAIDTHNLARTIVPKRVAPLLAPAVYQGPDHRALCALRRPTCPQSNDIERSQAGMQPQQRKHIGAVSRAECGAGCRRARGQRCVQGASAVTFMMRVDTPRASRCIGDMALATLRVAAPNDHMCGYTEPWCIGAM